MPVYEYVCDACGYGFERIQSFNDDPVEECPHCEGKVRRVISPVGVIFKGSGWYITDNRRQISGARKPKLSDHADSDGSAEGSASESSGDEKASSGKSESGDGRKPEAEAKKKEPSSKKKKPAAKTTD